ncbi:hypothetical protein RJT34_18534 [Clitoria ternatea]|uniref:Uncharacterized protein n=1 Tax=Clitoria ternatea TaxID=43366 RepID=A0AAN9PED3_CLITE
MNCWHRQRSPIKSMTTCKFMQKKPPKKFVKIYVLVPATASHLFQQKLMFESVRVIDNKFTEGMGLEEDKGSTWQAHCANNFGAWC